MQAIYRHLRSNDLACPSWAIGRFDPSLNKFEDGTVGVEVRDDAYASIGPGNHQCLLIATRKSSSVDCCSRNRPGKTL